MLSPSSFKIFPGAAKMAQPVRAFAALPGDTLIPINHSGSQLSVTLVPEDPMCSLASEGTGHAYGYTDIRADKAHKIK